MLKKKDLLGLKDISPEEIVEILDTADSMKKIVVSDKKDSQLLSGKTLISLFYENSTRTRTSFALAARYLGANEINMGVATSSVQKGETLKDTGQTLDSMNVDFIAIRHQIAGAPALLAKNVKASVINAGDGMNEHPTQALLDFLTIRQCFGTLSGLKVAILGDIKHSRVAKSNLFGLNKLESDVWMYCPGTLMPRDIEKLGAKIAKSREEALDGADVVMGLRIQLERQSGGLFPSLGEYSKYYGVNDYLLGYAKSGAVVLHPGPVNRGVELTAAVIDGEKSRILEQVKNGVAVRMAILKLFDEYRNRI